MTKTIADFLENAVPALVKQAEEAERRARECQAPAKEEWRRERARERARARQQARQQAKDELHAIAKAWNEAYALEAFFTELSRRAKMLDGEERTNLEARIRVARELMGGQDAVERFLKWTCSTDVEQDHDGEFDDGEFDED